MRAGECKAAKTACVRLSDFRGLIEHEGLFFFCGVHICRLDVRAAAGGFVFEFAFNLSARGDGQAFAGDIAFNPRARLDDQLACLD